MRLISGVLFDFSLFLPLAAADLPLTDTPGQMEMIGAVVCNCCILCCQCCALCTVVTITARHCKVCRPCCKMVDCCCRPVRWCFCPVGQDGKRCVGFCRNAWYGCWIRCFADCARDCKRSSGGECGYKLCSFLAEGCRRKKDVEDQRRKKHALR